MMIPALDPDLETFFQPFGDSLSGIRSRNFCNHNTSRLIIGFLTWNGEPGLVVLSKELALLDNRLCRGFVAAAAFDKGGFFSGSFAL